jgi:transcriptional regulator with XRE-family HTH domain
MKKIDRQEIGKRIKKIRGTYTQYQFAEKIGKRQGDVTKYENGRALPEPDTLLKIVCIGKVSLDWLLTGESEMFKEEKYPEFKPTGYKIKPPPKYGEKIKKEMVAEG